MLRCSKYCIYSFWADRIITGKRQQKTLPQTLQNLQDTMIILCTTPTPAPNEQYLKFCNSLQEGKKYGARDDDKSYKERDDEF